MRCRPGADQVHSAESRDDLYVHRSSSRRPRGTCRPSATPLYVTTDPADPTTTHRRHNRRTSRQRVDGALINLRWDRSTDDRAPQSFIRYDVYVNGALSAVVVGNATAQVEFDYGVTHTISIIAVDTADNSQRQGRLR